MKVMVLVKATKASEAGQMPSREMLAAMEQFNQRLIAAGVLLDAAGLRPTSKAKRIKFSGAQKMVIDGPFAEAKELVAGYWVWNVESVDDAVRWLKEAPFHDDEEVEIRPLFEPSDLE